MLVQLDTLVLLGFLENQEMMENPVPLDILELQV